MSEAVPCAPFRLTAVKRRVYLCADVLVAHFQRRFVCSALFAVPGRY